MEEQPEQEDEGEQDTPAFAIAPDAEFEADVSASVDDEMDEKPVTVNVPNAFESQPSRDLLCLDSNSDYDTVQNPSSGIQQQAITENQAEDLLQLFPTTETSRTLLANENGDQSLELAQPTLETPVDLLGTASIQDDDANNNDLLGLNSSNDEEHEDPFAPQQEHNQVLDELLQPVPSEQTSSSSSMVNAIPQETTIVNNEDESHPTHSLGGSRGLPSHAVAQQEQHIQSTSPNTVTLEPETSLLMELQTNLQQQMSLRAEAENTARLMEGKLQQLQDTVEEQQRRLDQLEELESNLDHQMSAKAEAENKVRLSHERVNDLETILEQRAQEVEHLQKQLVQEREDRALQEQELIQIRELREEQHRKEIALTNRLNAAKKDEAVKANLAEQYEDEIKALEQDLQLTKTELQETRSVKQSLEQDLETVKSTFTERLQRAEAALADERDLNEERKRKMKSFVEVKAEELRQAKSDNENLQNELNQTSRSLMDLNNRWKQLHAQWVQSQTRNRELQRDLNRIKKDSENLHKVGDTLEMKLSRSANETEEHKNKRLAAKHELMTVLRTLEAERELNAKLRDSIKFTFTPKALSQQQLLNEGLEEFEAQLQKLSLRIGKPLPPIASAAMHDASEPSEDSFELVNEDGVSRSDADAHRLIAKLEHETQHVSQCIMALSGNIERLHLLLDASGERTCYSVLAELLSTGSMQSSPAAGEETTSMTGQHRPLGSIRSHRYGQVPSGSRDL